jgi:hypothetical protein
MPVDKSAPAMGSKKKLAADEMTPIAIIATFAAVLRQDELALPAA